MGKALSLLVQEHQTARGIERLIWETAVGVYRADLSAILNDLGSWPSLPSQSFNPV